MKKLLGGAYASPFSMFRGQKSEWLTDTLVGSTSPHGVVAVVVGVDCIGSRLVLQHSRNFPP